MKQRLNQARRHYLAAALATTFVAALGTTSLAAQAAELSEVTYLLPAPANAIAFAPLMLAKHKNYYQDAGLDVEFVAVKGGADVGKQLGAGNAQLGGALGDTPIILRPNGIDIRGVALLGGQPLHQLMTRSDRNITEADDLKDGTLTVVAFQDTSFFAALAILAKAGLTRQDVDVQAGGPVGIWQQVALGKADGMVGAPEMGAFAEEEGAQLDWQSTGAFFPGMAQAVLASDDMIKNNPETVRKFVAATLKSIAEIREDPKAAAAAYIEAIPSYQGREALVEKVLSYYADNVYPGQEKPGMFDPARVEALQDYYFDQKIIRSKSAVDDLYTNQFVD